MSSPQDYEKESDIRQVQDVRAENGIEKGNKWNIIAQSLVVLSFTTTVGLSGYFGSRMASSVDQVNINMNHGMEKIGDTLIGIRKEVSVVSTGASVNSSRLNSVEKKQDTFEVRITKNSNDINYYLKEASNGKN